MNNWLRFKIIVKTDPFFIDEGLVVIFLLDNYVKFEDKNNNKITCANVSPFKDFGVNNYLEIDLDKISMKGSQHVFNDVSIVRKASSSEISRVNNNISMIPSISQNQVSGIVQQINAGINSDERNEYEAKIHVDPNSGRYSGFSIIGRRK